MRGLESFLQWLNNISLSSNFARLKPVLFTFKSRTVSPNPGMAWHTLYMPNDADQTVTEFKLAPKPMYPGL